MTTIDRTWAINLLDFLTTNEMWTVSLLTGDPGVDANGDMNAITALELDPEVDLGYEPAVVSAAVLTIDAVENAKFNSVEITFGTNTGQTEWAEVTHLHIATASDGPFVVVPLLAPVAVQPGREPRIPVNGLKVSVTTSA